MLAAIVGLLITLFGLENSGGVVEVKLPNIPPPRPKTS